MSATLTHPRRRTPAPPAAPEPEPLPEPPQPLDLDALAARWQSALDAADDAARAAAADRLAGAGLAGAQRALVQERHETADTLARLARVAGIKDQPWLAPVRVTPALLGLPAETKACLFDLDDVLTDSSSLHAWAWASVFDDFLLRLSERAGWHFIAFDRVKDYRDYIDGRQRLEGVHTFLASRGIRVPEGRPDDPADADTAYGLARRKGDALDRELRRRGVATVPGARRYLDAAGRAGVARAVLSASAATSWMLELAGLASFADVRVDADAMRVLGLRSRPAPDAVIAACVRLNAKPEETVAFTHTAAGIAAGRSAGVLVVGVGEGTQGELLTGFGADRVVPSLAALLDRRLSA